MIKGAIVSECGCYRYSLTRIWDASLPRVCWIMLNPSTADGAIDDPTIRKCIGFAKKWGYGSIEVVNLFAFRATDPRDLPSNYITANGNDNHPALAMALSRAALVVCAWGAHHSDRTKPAWTRISRTMYRYLQAPKCLGTTKEGHPRHPLYVPYSAELVDFRREG